MNRKWTQEEIWDWYKARPWITGFNFIPSGAMDGAVWMLQEYDHENAFRDAAKEIALADLTVSAFLFHFIYGGYSMTAL